MRHHLQRCLADQITFAFNIFSWPILLVILIRCPSPALSGFSDYTKAPQLSTSLLQRLREISVVRNNLTFGAYCLKLSTILRPVTLGIYERYRVFNRRVALMAVITNARMSFALGVGQSRATNRANVGLDRGMLKGFGERLMHDQNRRLSMAGAINGARRPYIFINNPLEERRPRTNRRGNLSRLRKLEKRNYWWQSIRESFRSSFSMWQRLSPFKNYSDQLRFVR
jgi:hypothetical protein